MNDVAINSLIQINKQVDGLVYLYKVPQTKHRVTSFEINCQTGVIVNLLCIHKLFMRIFLGLNTKWILKIKDINKGYFTIKLNLSVEVLLIM